MHAKIGRTIVAAIAGAGLFVPFVVIDSVIGSVTGTSTASAAFVATVDPTLEAPTNVCAQSDGNVSRISWDASTDPRVEGHIVEYQDWSGTSWFVGADVKGTATSAQVFTARAVRFRVSATTATNTLRSTYGTYCVVAAGASPVTSDGTALAHQRVAKVVGGTESMTCYLTLEGKVLCHTVSATAQVGGLLADRTIVDIHADDSIACALDSTHALYCWGASDAGLGDGVSTSSESPVAATGGALAGQAITDFDVGGGMVCASTAAGAVVCWGADGDGTPDPTPRAMGGALLGVSVADIDVSGGSACARTTTGRLICWGYNVDFLDPAGSPGWFDPKVIDLRSFTAAAIADLAMSNAHRCVLTAAGGVGCWGRNDQGQVGTSDSTVVQSPSLVQGNLAPEIVTAIDTQGDRTCARVQSIERVLCWGLQEPGVVIRSPRDTPVRSIGGNVANFTAAGPAGVWNGLVDYQVRPSVPSITAVSVTGRDVDLTHSASMQGSYPITGYSVEGSVDGVSWFATPDIETPGHITVTAPSDGVWQFRILADATVSSLPSTPTDPIVIATGPPVTMSPTLTFVTDKSVPIVGAAVAWSSNLPASGTAAASTNASGAVAIGPIPSGRVTFTLTHGTVAGTGTLVTGTYVAVMDPDAINPKVVVRQPTRVSRAVTVQMPNGRKIAGATLTSLSGGVQPVVQFGTGGNVQTGTWNSGVTIPTTSGVDGRISITGLDAPTVGTDAVITVKHGPSGSITETAFAYLNANSVAQIPMFAYLEVLSTRLTYAEIGAAVDVRVRAVNAQGVLASGVKVALSTVNGASASRTGCTAVTSATTAVGTGEATLRLCPTIGGAWTATASGFEGATYLVPLAPAPVQAAMSGGHTCVRRANRTIACVGNNNNGQLGNGSFGTINAVPVEVTGITSAIGVAVGSAFSCALLVGGTVRCWGQGTQGHLGNGATPLRQPTPVQVTVLGTNAGLTGVSQIDAWLGTACAVVNPGPSGNIYCWGDNAAGQLGDGTVTTRSRAVRVKVSSGAPLTGAVRVAVGELSACAVMASGVVRCWGANDRGQLGNGTTRGSRYAVAVAGFDGVAAKASSITAGLAYSCATLTNGTARCWGANSLAQTGTGRTSSNVLIPTTVRTSSGTLTGVRQVSAGIWNTCALAGTGAGARVWCWGSDDGGELGFPPPSGLITLARTARVVPSTSLSGAISIEVGPRQAMAIVPNALRPATAVVAWGRESNRELGLGGQGIVWSPRVVKKM